MEKRKLAKTVSCVVLSVVLIVLFGMFSAMHWRLNGDQVKNTAPGLSEISRIVDMPLNQYRSCVLVGSSHHHIGQANTLLARAEMSRSDARRLVSKYEDYTTDDRLRTRNNMWGENPSWWDPDSVHKYKTIEFGQTVILIGLDRSDKAVLYIWRFT